MPLKNEEEAYEKIVEMSNNNDYTTGNQLDFAYFKDHNRLTASNLSKQTNLKDPQQTSFIGRPEENSGATIFFVTKKLEETTFNFSQNSVMII